MSGHRRDSGRLLTLTLQCLSLDTHVTAFVCLRLLYSFCLWTPTWQRLSVDIYSTVFVSGHPLDIVRLLIPTLHFVSGHPRDIVRLLIRTPHFVSGHPRDSFRLLTLTPQCLSLDIHVTSFVCLHLLHSVCLLKDKRQRSSVDTYSTLCFWTHKSQCLSLDTYSTLSLNSQAKACISGHYTCVAAFVCRHLGDSVGLGYSCGCVVCGHLAENVCL